MKARALTIDLRIRATPHPFRDSEHRFSQRSYFPSNLIDSTPNLAPESVLPDPIIAKSRANPTFGTVVDAI